MTEHYNITYRRTQSSYLTHITTQALKNAEEEYIKKIQEGCYQVFLTKITNHKGIELIKLIKEFQYYNTFQLTINQ